MPSNPDNKEVLANPEESPRRTWGGETILRQEVADTPADTSLISGPLQQPLVDSGSGTRYGFTRIHASGGIGRVWLARDRTFNRDRKSVV